MGWGIQNFKTPGSPWGGGFEIPWGIPNTTNNAVQDSTMVIDSLYEFSNLDVL